MTNGEAVNWLINISADIGKSEHSDWWRYEQALSEIREMRETAQPDVPDTNVGDTVSRQAAIDRAVSIPMFGRDIKMVAVSEIENLPSAQPEIIYCKDCKWKQGAECVRFADVRPFPSDFCSRAERREE